MCDLKKQAAKASLVCLVSAFCCTVSWAGISAPQKYVLPRVTFHESIRAMNGELVVRGRVLLSYEDKFVFIQSGNTFLQIQRELIKGAGPACLDQPGTQVSFQIPQRAIHYAWTVDGDQVAGR